MIGNLSIKSKHNYFFERQTNSFRPGSLWVFLGFSLVAMIIIFAAHIYFPGQNNFPWIIRNALIALVIVFLLSGIRYLLKKNNFPANVLQLSFSKRAAINLLLGIFIAFMTMIIMGLTLYIFVPFHFERGALSVLDVSKDALNYFTGNFIEELIFRGYPLILLTQFMGWRRAVWLLALPFGLSHLMGMDSGIEALKMVATTSAFSFVFCFAFILTGTLWTSISLHVTVNLLLHAVTGLDGAGRSYLIPVFVGEWPTNYDAAFFVFLLTSILMSGLLFCLIRISMEGNTENEVVGVSNL